VVALIAMVGSTRGLNECVFGGEITDRAGTLGVVFG
jgi:hypothetical protein